MVDSTKTSEFWKYNNYEEWKLLWLKVGDFAQRGLCAADWSYYQFELLKNNVILYATF